MVQLRSRFPVTVIVNDRGLLGNINKTERKIRRCTLDVMTVKV